MIEKKQNLEERGNEELAMSASGSMDMLLQRLKEFEDRLTENSREPNPEAVKELIGFLERAAETPERVIEVYTDPNLTTYCCAMVPTKRVLPTGQIVDDPKAKTFLIGVPTSHLLGLAPIKFLLGEILHERGHAEWTSFDGIKSAISAIKGQGYDPEAYKMLDNCVEDPRMERLVGEKLCCSETTSI